MFLSRIELGPRAAEHEAFWREASSPYGAHQALWRVLSRAPDQRREFLFRMEERLGRPSFLVLSRDEPTAADDGLWKVESKPFAPSLRVGQRLAFRLRASPVVRRREVPDAAGRRRAQRHDVVMDRKRKLAADGSPPLDAPSLIHDAGLAWLRQQGQRHAFKVVESEAEVIGDDGLLEPVVRPAVRVDGYRQHRILRRGETAIRFSSVDFEGLLEVADPAAFLDSVVAGFGPQKAFGCGLMLLRRA
jgi:CRISPR system Cascade subunit CasE